VTMWDKCVINQHLWGFFWLSFVFFRAASYGGSHGGGSHGGGFGGGSHGGGGGSRGGGAGFGNH
nr:hypothetical protein [Eubacteriales bacterium]